jgi:7-carboxy-7-deazaguanine synthase
MKKLDDRVTETLRITEIFYSLQGESRTVGLPTVFIRLTGCPLRCGYCDTSYAFQGGTVVSLEDVLTKVRTINAQYVTVTGGEPLAQKFCLLLLKKLCDDHYQVSLETSGALDIAPVDPRVIKVMDLKTPGSGEMQRNHYENIQFLSSQDQIKFVICDQTDYEWAKQQIQKFKLTEKCELLFSPSHGQLANVKLAEWILADRLPVRFQIQLHKYIWGDVPGR